jgi:hypothetical protein
MAGAGAGTSVRELTTYTCFVRKSITSYGMFSSVARNFKLLDELEDAEKSNKGGADVSLGTWKL